MRPLLKNDLLWAGPLGIAGLIIYLLTFCSHSVATFWIIPDIQGGAGALGFGPIAATVLGLVAGLVEDVTRTREYVLHRPVSVERVFWTRHALGLAIVVAWLVLGPTLHLLGSHLFSPNAALLDDGRLAIIVGFGLPSLLFYALGVWVASFPRTLIGGTLLLAVIGIPLWLAVFTGVLLTPTAFGVAVVVASLALTPWLLRAALAAVRTGRDADRPWTAARLRRAGPVAALVAILAGSVAATLAEVSATAGLLNLYPMASEHEGKVILYRYSHWDDKNHQTDEQHRLGPAVEPNWAPRLFEPIDDAWRLDDSGHVRYPAFPQRGRYHRGVLYTTVFFSTDAHQVVLGSDGFVHLYTLAADDGRGDDRPRYARLGKGPQNLPFSPRTKRAGGTWEQVGALFDPADGGLWLYDVRSGAPGFHRAELPGGDRFVTSDWLRYYFPTGVYKRPPPLSPLFVWGERGRYALNQQGQFEPTTADENSMPAPRRREHVTHHSPTSFTGTATSIDGKTTLFTHEYRPYTLAEQAMAALVYAPALLRPPLTSLPSLLTPEQKAHDFGRLLLDPAVARAGRWLVPANLIVALGLALLAYRRLGRLGITGGRRRFWVGVVIAGGLPGYLCQRLVETRRAWQPMPAADKAVATPVLMIPDLPAVRPA